RRAHLPQVQQADARRSPPPGGRTRRARLPALRRTAGRRLSMAVARLRERYRTEIAPALMRDLGVKNTLAVPRLHKIVLNMGLGEATQKTQILDSAVEEL